MQDAYDEATYGLDTFGADLCRVIAHALQRELITVHSVSFRVKERESVQRKMAGDPEQYSKPADLGDLLGVRVITYFTDEVQAVAEIIEREFTVDLERSVDKRAILDPDRFGYLSLHYSGQLDARRGDLAEYIPFGHRRFEVQIRTILQHAWAEIEHDLGYKSEVALPREMRRRFSRLAGLLEIADEEFSTLRRDLQKYSDTIGSEIAAAPRSVDVNQTSVAEFIRGSEMVASMDQELNKLWRRPVVGSITESWAARRAEGLLTLRIGDIATLEAELEENHSLVQTFARLWATDRRVGLRVSPGLSLYYLELVLAAQSGPEVWEQWRDVVGLSPTEVQRHDVLAKVELARSQISGGS